MTFESPSGGPTGWFRGLILWNVGENQSKHHSQTLPETLCGPKPFGGNVVRPTHPVDAEMPLRIPIGRYSRVATRSGTRRIDVDSLCRLSPGKPSASAGQPFPATDRLDSVDRRRSLPSFRPEYLFEALDPADGQGAIVTQPVDHIFLQQSTGRRHLWSG